MSLLQMSFSAAVLTLVVMVIRALAINRLPKMTFLVLWGVVLCRLLIPFSIPSPLSVYNTLLTQTENNVPISNIGTIPPVMLDGTSATISPATQVAVNPPAIPWMLIVWLAGFMACVLFYGISYWSCCRKFATALPVQNDVVSEWLMFHQVKRNIVVHQSDRIAVPLTYGVFHPVILLPKRLDWSNEQQLKYILAHEYVHIRRFDAVTKLLLTTALCIHWFNPIVWVMFIMANRDMELSCDETVVRSFGETTKSAYARALIGMEERKSGLLPLCNSFSKNAIEERITAIMKIKKTSLFAVLVAVCLIFGISTAFVTSAASSVNTASNTTDNTLDEKGKQMLDKFKFSGYETMSVAEFQEKVWQLLDKTPDYRERLELLSQNGMLYKMRDTNDAANFLFYVLSPLTAENWKTRQFNGYVTSNFSASDNATLEYSIDITILDANRLSVSAYSDTRNAITTSLHGFFQRKTVEELQNEVIMEEQIKNLLNSLTKEYSNEYLQISFSYDFKPLMFYDADAPDLSLDNEQEPRQFGSATAADYESLFALKTANYQNMSIADFNAAVLDWGNEDYERMERIREDSFREDYQIALTEEERSFAALTVQLSGEENYRMIQSDRFGTPEEDAWVGGIILNKETEDGSFSAWCQLYYQFSYRIVDKGRLTVGERDRYINGIIHGIQTFWDKKSLDELLKMSESDFIAQFYELAKENSNDLITINIDENQIQFEGMDERQLHQ